MGAVVAATARRCKASDFFECLPAGCIEVPIRVRRAWGESHVGVTTCLEVFIVLSLAVLVNSGLADCLVRLEERRVGGVQREKFGGGAGAVPSR